MEILFRLLLTLQVIISIMLIGIVIIQRSKGQGVGLSFGGGAEAIFGAQMGNVITRATVVLAIVFLLNTAVLAVIRPISKPKESAVEREAARVAAEAVKALPASTTAVDDSEAMLNILDAPLTGELLTPEPATEEEPKAEPEEAKTPEPATEEAQSATEEAAE